MRSMPILLQDGDVPRYEGGGYGDGGRSHVYLDKEYHAEESSLARFAWLHFVYHLHTNSNFAVIDFFWDRLLATYRSPDTEVR
jgi:hypothetical protein